MPRLILTTEGKPQGGRYRRHCASVPHSVRVGTAAVRYGARNGFGGALEETRLSGLPLARFCPPAASETNRRKSPRIDRLLRAVRDDRVMGRSGTNCTTDADLAAGLFTPSREDSFEADVGPGERPHRRSPAGRNCRMAATAVKILNDHLETASAAWQAYRAPTPKVWFDLLSRDLSVLPQLRQTVGGTARRTPRRRDSAWRDGNADAGAGIGR